MLTWHTHSFLLSIQSNVGCIHVPFCVHVVFHLAKYFSLRFKLNGLINIVLSFFAAYKKKIPLSLSLFIKQKSGAPLLCSAQWNRKKERGNREKESVRQVLDVLWVLYSSARDCAENALMTQLFNYTNAFLISWIFSFFFIKSVYR